MSSSLRGGDPPQIAYLHGFHHALNVAVLLALTGAIVALATIRNRTSQPIRAGHRDGPQERSTGL